jgi:hypothetical protein
LAGLLDLLLFIPPSYRVILGLRPQNVLNRDLHYLTDYFFALFRF